MRPFKHIRRIASALLACVLALTMLVGCGDGNSSYVSSLTLSGLNDAVNSALETSGHGAVEVNADATKKMEQFCSLEKQLQFTYNLTGEAKAKAEAANEKIYVQWNAIWDDISASCNNNWAWGGYERYAWRLANFNGEDNDYKGWSFFVESPQTALAQYIADDIAYFEEYRSARFGESVTVTGIAYAIEEDMPLDVDFSNQTVDALYVYYFFDYNK